MCLTKRKILWICIVKLFMNIIWWKHCSGTINIIWKPHPSWGLVSWPWHLSPALPLWCRCGRIVAGGEQPGLQLLLPCHQAAVLLPPAIHPHSGGQREILLSTGSQGPLIAFSWIALSSLFSKRAVKLYLNIDIIDEVCFFQLFP